MDCLKSILTTTEAAEIWQMPRNTIQAACLRGVLEIGVECRKSGRDWLVTRVGMLRHYGNPPSAQQAVGADLTTLPQVEAVEPEK